MCDNNEEIIDDIDREIFELKKIRQSFVHDKVLCEDCKANLLDYWKHGSYEDKE
tara:strand:+ start:588 stop:749 length:162 start_codon:yes stop_codon:yes gene_type:complete